MGKITGADQHKQRLRRMRGPAAVRGITRALFKVAQDIAVDASLSITTGAVSGKNHQASAPGEAPNADTGVLHNSITGVSTGPLKAETAADAPYAAAQELGSGDLPERPYLRPALAKNRGPAVQGVVDAVNRVIRAGGQ